MGDFRRSSRFAYLSLTRSNSSLLAPMEARLSPFELAPALAHPPDTSSAC